MFANVKRLVGSYSALGRGQARGLDRGNVIAISYIMHY
jgi:hypothetical protein